jgi:hypothetical protein
MRRILLFAAVLTLTVPAFSAAASASCIPMSPAEKRARAQVVFDGVALEGPTATGIQRFRVARYLKGRGPQVVRVDTGNVRRADGTGTVTSVSIVVARGERWRIFGKGDPYRVVRTSVCDGSRKL